MVWNITEDYLTCDRIPSRIAMLIRDIIAFRNRHIHQPYEVKKEKGRSYINILFHNRRIELINLPRILHDKNVVGTVPLIENLLLLVINIQILFIVLFLILSQ